MKLKVLLIASLISLVSGPLLPYLRPSSSHNTLAKHSSCTNPVIAANADPDDARPTFSLRRGSEPWVVIGTGNTVSAPIDRNVEALYAVKAEQDGWTASPAVVVIDTNAQTPSFCQYFANFVMTKTGSPGSLTLTGEGFNRSYTLRWNSVANARTYKVFRNDNAILDTPSITTSGTVEPGQSVFRVEAYDSANTKIATSNNLTLTILNSGPAVGQSADQGDCGCGSSLEWAFNLVRKAICEASCALSKALGGIVEFFVNGLLNAAGVSRGLDLRLADTCWFTALINHVVPTAHAQESITPPPQIDVTLADQLDEAKSNHQWLFEIWRLAIGIVNVGVVLFIVFIALATILHWNVDTYGFKKALPTLIIGVILANFSLLISRGLVDLASILTSTLAGEPRVLAEGLIRALGLTNVTGLAGIFAGAIIAAFFPPVGLLTLLAGIILVFLPAILIAILWFLLLVRIGIVLVLAAVSPLAFAALGFPGTQQWFRRWWSMYLNWVFMVPAVFLLLRIAASMSGVANIESQNDGPALLVYVMALGVLWFAIQVPFKMGGAIMSGWAGLGKLAAGTGWKSYGSLGRKAQKEWVDKPGLTGVVGRTLVATNLYGVRTALKERGERAERYREQAFREGAAFQALGGYDVGYRYHLDDKKEAINNIEDPAQLQKLAQKYVDKYDSLKELSEEDLRDLIYTSPGKQQELYQKYGVNMVDAGWITNIMRRAQRLQVRVRQPFPIKDTLNDMLTDEPGQDYASRVRAGEYQDILTEQRQARKEARAKKKQEEEERKRREEEPPPEGGPPPGTPPPGGPRPGTTPPVSGGAPEAGFRDVGLNDAQIRRVMERLGEGHAAVDIAHEMGIGAQFTPGGTVRIYDPQRYRTFQRVVGDLVKRDPELSGLHNAQFPTNMWVRTLQTQRKEGVHTQLEASYKDLDASIRRLSKDPNFAINPVLEQHARVLLDLNPQINPTYLADLKRDPNKLLGEIGHAARAANVLRGNIDLPEQQLTARVRQSVNLERDIRVLRGHIQDVAATAPNYEQAVAAITQDANLQKLVGTQVQKISQRTGQRIDPARFLQTIQQSSQQYRDIDDLISFSSIRDSLRSSSVK